jgi:SAM-dependent methyltransferase
VKVDGLIDLLKRVPIDLGQGAVAERTQGKQIALGLVSPGQGKRALDVGAREGHQTRWLRERGYDVTSLDIEPQFPECLAANVDEGLPFEEESFDLVWCAEVIEHLKDPEHALREFRRVTKPGGDIVLTTPNSYAWLFRLVAWFGLTPQRLQRKDHLHFFDLDAVTALAPDAELYGYFPYAIVKRTIRRGVGALSPTFVMHIRKR